MRKIKLWHLAVCLFATSAMMLSSCQNANDEVINLKGNLQIEERNSATIFNPSAQPYGKSHAEWGQEFWKANLALSCEEAFSFLTLSLDQNVVTLAGPLGEFTEYVTVSRHQSIFLPLVTSIYDYPCPDPEFEPAPGQTLEEFLQEGVSSLIDMVENLQVELDGVSLGDMEEYRALSDLFYFTGNSELAECFDPCVTGESQPGVTDGYWIMFKKMQPGTYTLTMHGEIPVYEFEWDITVVITVE